MSTKKQITILGGGNGGSISIRAMKQHLDHYDISAIIAMSDSGSSSGQLRKEFGVLPPGDILRAVLAMSRYDYETLKRIFYESRYSKHGKLKGFGLGHLFIAFVEKYDGNIVNAIRPLAQALDAVGPVFPVTLTESDLCVELTDGREVCGEHEIDRPDWDRSIKIKRAWLDTNPQMYERARQQVLESNVIIIGPGSFYTSIIATLLPDGMQQALAETKAKLIYVPGNAIEADGETGPECLSEFVATLHNYLPRQVDAVVYNTGGIGADQAAFYAEKNWKEVVCDPDNVPDVPMIGAAYESAVGGVDHELLGNVVHNWIHGNL
jgi:uncharacterized cofD-like protein